MLLQERNASVYRVRFPHHTTGSPLEFPCPVSRPLSLRRRSPSPNACVAHSLPSPSPPTIHPAVTHTRVRVMRPLWVGVLDVPTLINFLGPSVVFAHLQYTCHRAWVAISKHLYKFPCHVNQLYSLRPRCRRGRRSRTMSLAE